MPLYILFIFADRYGCHRGKIYRGVHINVHIAHENEEVNLKSKRQVDNILARQRRASIATAMINKTNSATKPDPWLEACVYACARLLAMAMHAYARLHPNTPHACVRLGSGT